MFLKSTRIFLSRGCKQSNLYQFLNQYIWSLGHLFLNTILYSSLGSLCAGLSLISTLHDKCYLWASSMCHCTWYRLGSRSHRWYCTVRTYMLVTIEQSNIFNSFYCILFTGTYICTPIGMFVDSNKFIYFYFSQFLIRKNNIYLVFSNKNHIK